MSTRPAYWGFSDDDYTPPCIISPDNRIIDLTTAPVQTWASLVKPERAKFIKAAVTRWQIAVDAGAAPRHAAGYGLCGEGLSFLRWKECDLERQRREQEDLREWIRGKHG